MRLAWGSTRSSGHRRPCLPANAGMAVLLGVATAVGGGVARDVLLTRVPVILRTEIYALAALVGASIQVLGGSMGWSLFVTPWLAASIAIAIRLLALRYGWQLPTSSPAAPPDS